VIPLPDILNIL